MDNGLNLVQVACDAALAAGKEILKVYDTEFEVEWKQDQSPVTTADKKASVIIRRILDLTEIKVVCEEGDGHDFEGRKGCSQIWLVDPIDGTKEFIKRNGEFTVNIALVENGRPLLGIVYAPVLKLLYVASEATGALKFTNVEPSDAVKLNEKERLNSAQKLPLQKLPEVYTVAISRSYLSIHLNAHIKKLSQKYVKSDTLKSGSSLKFCYLAEGKAHEYPRFGSIMEWDTAAGHCILNFSGGQVIDMYTGEPIHYNKEDLHQPEFLALAKS